MIARSEAVHLFAERASSVLTGFALTESNSRAIAQICVRLDGIPLALELAAARVPFLSVDQLSSRLANTLRLLTSGDRNAPTRQQTLRATLDWSYGLLTEYEQRLLQRLSVFAGSWTLEAAEAVCASDDLPSEQVLDALGRLVDKSLVIVERYTDEGVRYRLLETIRQKGAELFQREDACKPIRHAHLAFFLSLAEQFEPQLLGPDQRAGFEQLERDLDNFRAALDWSMTDSGRMELGLRLASALRLFWDNRAHLREGRDRLAALLAEAGPNISCRTRAKALFADGYIRECHFEPESARAAADESVALWRAVED
jgi:non-specific serine/threonine protein kinase